MTFDEIIETSKYKKREDDKINQIRHQRQLCGEIIAGFVHRGFRLTDTEHKFVLRCNRAMKPVSGPVLSVLQKLNDRRWGR